MGLLGKRKEEGGGGAAGVLRQGGWAGGASPLLNGHVNKRPGQTVTAAASGVYCACIYNQQIKDQAAADHLHHHNSSAGPTAPFFFPLEQLGFIGNSKLRNHPSGCDHQLRREAVSMH